MAGMDDYVSKPIRLEGLARALSQARPTHKAVVEAPPEPAGGFPQSRSPIDEDILRRLGLTIGSEDRGTLDALVRDYLAESPGLLSDLRRACDRGETDQVRRISHSQSPAARCLGPRVSPTYVPPSRNERPPAVCQRPWSWSHRPRPNSRECGENWKRNHESLDRQIFAGLNRSGLNASLEMKQLLDALDDLLGDDGLG